MKKQYKLAFIGGGINSIAGYPHFISSQMDGLFKVVTGAFSSDEETNKLTAEKWGITSLHTSWQSLIEKERNNIDAVVILTPTPLHVDIIKELLQNDIPVICEKALVSSKEELDEILAVYNPQKHFLVVTNNYSGYPMVRELRKKIQSLELGNILNIRLEMPQESFLRPPQSIKYPQSWRLSDKYIPSISLDLGAHLHHLAYFLLGLEPKQVMAEYNSFSKYNIVDDVTMLLRYSQTLSGSFWISKVALGHRNGLSIEVYGDKASAYWKQENPEKLEISYQNGEKTTIDRGSNILIENSAVYNRMTPGHPAGFIEAFANLYVDIAQALSDYFDKTDSHNPYIYGIEHAVDGVNLLHSASDSNAEQKWMKIIK